MTAERWAQVRSFVEAAVLLPEGERGKFLEELRRQDASLWGEVQPLVAAEGEASALFSIEQWHVSAEDLPGNGAGSSASPLAAGRVIGRYRLVRELGRGGMGTVFLAERADGEFQQLVALKTLQESLHGKALIER